MVKVIRWLTAVGFALVTGSAGADVITFSSGSTGPATEGDFTYNTHSGALFSCVVFVCGNPPPDMEGLGTGGVLRVVRSDGGLFTFDGVDAAQAGMGVTTIRFRGVQGSVLQAVDDLLTSGIDGHYVGGTQNSVNLAGVSIDELLIELDASLLGWEAVDNIRL